MQKSKILSRAASRDKNQKDNAKLKTPAAGGFRNFAFCILHFELSAKREGFTLLETIVALILIVTAIIGPFTLASRGIFNAKFTKSKLTALNLAQEGLEIVRHLRDTNVINGNDWRGGSCAVPAVCTVIPDGSYNVDVLNSQPGSPQPFLGGVINPLIIDGVTGLFARDSLARVETSPAFTRTMEIRAPVGGEVDPDVPVADQMMVISKVEWNESGMNREVSLRELFYNWR